jgi:hypothetical protein
MRNKLFRTAACSFIFAFLYYPANGGEENVELIVLGRHISCIKENAEAYLTAFGEVIFVDVDACPETGLNTIGLSAKNVNPVLKIDADRKIDKFLVLTRKSFKCLTTQGLLSDDVAYKVSLSNCKIERAND